MKTGIALFCMLLIVLLPVAEAQLIKGEDLKKDIQTERETIAQKVKEIIPGVVSVNKTEGQIAQEIIGEDIVVNIEEYQPKIIRSSIIEDQPVLVYALLSGTPVNPTIRIKAIRDVRIVSLNVTTIPISKQAVVGSIRYVPPSGSFINYDNLGYLVIPLRQIPKEIDVPENIIIDAKIRLFFDVSEGLGVSEHEDVLQEQTKEEWESEKEMHRFFGGYVRAADINVEDAGFVVYDPNGNEISSVKLKEGQVSNVIDSKRSSLAVDVFDKFRIRLDEIKGQSSRASFLIIKDSQTAFRELHEGSSLYAGSEWQVYDIGKTSNCGSVSSTGFFSSITGRLHVGIHDPPAEIKQETYCVILRNKRGDMIRMPLGRVSETEGVEETLTAEAEGKFRKAIGEYQKVIDNYGNLKDASGELYALKAQKRIVDIYYNELNDLVNGEEAYKNLIEKFGDDLTSGEIYDYQLRLDTLMDERAGKAYSKVLMDNGQNIKISLTNVKIFSRESDSGVRVAVTAPDRVREAGILRVGDRIDDFSVSGNKFEVEWIIDSIEDDKITIIPLGVQENIDFKAVIIRPGGSVNVRINKIPEDLKASSERVTANVRVEEIFIKKEAKITIIPESEKAFSESVIKINLPIEKRVLGPAIFSKSLDQEIGRAQDLIRKLDEIITSLEKIHKFWAQFCFATFTILWGKNLLFGGGRNAVVRQKLSEQWKEKYADARASRYRKSYDSFIFEHKEEYETDFTNTGNIVDSIKSGAYQGSLPPEIRGLGNDYDEYKKDYYFLKESLKYEEDPAGQKTLFRQFATLTASTATTRIDNEFTAYEKAASWDELDEESKNKIRSFISGNSGFSNLKDKLEGSDEERYASLYRTHEAQILKNYREYRLNKEYDRYFGQGVFKKELEAQVGADIVNKNLDEIDNLADTYRPGGSAGDLIEISIRDINNNELLFGGKRYVVDEGKVAESLESKAPVEIMGLGKVRFVEEAKSPEYKHIPKIAVVEEGKARGKVSRISIDPTKYVDVEYSSSGNPVKYTVFERASPNGPLGRSSDYLKGTLELEIIELSERAKYDKTAQEELNRLRGVQRCVALVNDRLGKGNYVRGSQTVNCGNDRSYVVESVGPKEEPLVGASCTDFMSPGDCKLLFNACDPVVCPASRCNFGGRLEGEVKNVVESGIIGSIALCLPNAKEGIIMPVCLTGLLAGLQNIRSVLQGYEQCLKIAKVQGQSVGICDRLRSFYLCDILWREAITVLNLKGGIVGMLSEKVFDAGSGGGEYAYFKMNVENSVNSLGYFTQNYAKNVFASYSGGSLPEIGAEVCKAMISKKLPGVGNFFTQVQRPESPPQFTAFFDDIPYSDITTPPQSQYSVFYHIYAGENEDISFSVYLRGSLANVLTLRPAFVVMNRKLQRGGFASENIDRVAQTGYNEICVEIRTRTYGLRTECGFNKVSTNFALSRLNELFISKEAGKQIRSEEECVPETTRLTSLEYDSGFKGGINPGRTVVGANSPGLLETGLLRQCSKFDPDVGTGKDNWAPVGTCGKDNLGRDLGACWLYKPSITENIKDANIEGATLEKLPEIAEKVAGEIADVDRPLTKQEVIEHAKTARRLGDVGDYDAAIEIYQNIVIRALEGEDSAMAQFEIGVIYEKWAREIKEEVIKKSVAEHGEVHGTDEEHTETKSTEAQKETEAKLSIKIIEFGQMSNFNSIKESGIPFSYYADTFLKNVFGLQSTYNRNLGRKTSEKAPEFSESDTIRSYFDKLSAVYGLRYTINEEGAIVFSESDE